MAEITKDENGDENVYTSRRVHLLQCGAVTDVENGEDMVAFTVMGVESGDIEALGISLDDARTLAVRVLVSLYTSKDAFAEKVLDDCFPSDNEGRFYWPKVQTFE